MDSLACALRSTPLQRKVERIPQSYISHSHAHTHLCTVDNRHWIIIIVVFAMLYSGMENVLTVDI